MEKKINIVIEESMPTAFLNSDRIYQDGTTPMYRDKDGSLWAMSGHSHMCEIAMFKGTSLDDIKKVYPINLNFCVGHADFAFNGVCYPEGVKARGSMWPFGLYICPVTHRFFCLFHNETGWNGKGTGYDAEGYCDTPKCDWDFRHIGLMHSDDEGKNWTFDRWVLTSEEVCFTDTFNPGAGNVLGQTGDVFSCGSGDFSTYIDDEYIYIFYNIIRANRAIVSLKNVDVYVARTRRREDGIMGDFVKYYNGAFTEPGNFGKETPIAYNSWHPRVIYLEKYGVYLMTASYADPTVTEKMIKHETQMRISTDLVNWGEVYVQEYEGKPFGNHYVALVSDDTDTQPSYAKGDRVSFLTNHNGTDVTRYKAHIE